MKTSLCILLFAAMAAGALAQEKEDPVYRMVEVMPTIGDCASLEEETQRTRCTMERIIFHIQSEVVYPKELAEFGVEGTVYVNFVVDKEGVIKKSSVVRGVESSLDAEALRVVNSLPKFKPGQQGGKPVSVEYTIPIQFKVSEYEIEEELEDED